MPDWQELVRRELSGLALDAAEKDEVHAELAAHLEESYEALLKEGVAEPAAFRCALSQVSNWQDLQRRIYAARNGKDTMTNRVKQLWLPGLLTFTVSMALVALGQKLGPRPLFLKLGEGIPFLQFYPGWLLTLPLAGAIGASLSKRAGGTLRMALASSVFPVLPYVVVFLIAIPAGLMMGGNHYIATRALFWMAIGWVLVPGLALLAGGLLAHMLFGRRPSSQRAANS